MRGDYYVYSMFWNYGASDATIILMLITDKALAMLKQRVASSSAWGARLNISGGGCGGYTYELSYAESPNLTDIVYHDILVVDIQSKEYLVDAKLDWVVSELNEMFQITNAKESGRCGCGESFYI